MTGHGSQHLESSGLHMFLNSSCRFNTLQNGATVEIPEVDNRMN
jgi:hypothetical protein